MSPLGFLSRGDRAEVVEIRISKGTCAEGKNHAVYAEDIGLRVGRIVEMLNNSTIGPVLLKVDESRIAISRGLAMKIMVRKQ